MEKLLKKYLKKYKLGVKYKRKSPIYVSSKENKLLKTSVIDSDGAYGQMRRSQIKIKCSMEAAVHSRRNILW